MKHPTKTLVSLLLTGVFGASLALPASAAFSLADNQLTRALGPLAGEFLNQNQDDPNLQALEEQARRFNEAKIARRKMLDPSYSEPVYGVSTHGLLKWEGKDNAAPFEQLNVPETAVQDRLPHTVYLRDNQASYNRYYEAALLDGVVYIRHRGVAENWREAPMPEELKGKIVSLSMDNNELVCLDENNWVYTCGRVKQDPSQWYWITAWGELYKVGNAYQIGNRADYQWCLSFIDPDDDVTYTTIDGKRQPVGASGVCQLLYVDPEDPTRIIYSDPWLPRDASREVGTPMHCRFQVAGMSGSASTTFVINEYGDMFTRLYDYDLAGGDVILFSYSWLDQGDKEPSTDRKVTKQDKEGIYADVRLPAPDWQKQPKIPGGVTNRISIEATAPGSENRLLKVEGTKDGQTGYWQKMLEAPSWEFVPTGDTLKGRMLENSPDDTSGKGLAPRTGIHYLGRIGQTGAFLEVRDFAYNDSKQEARIHVGKRAVPATLYMEYGNLGYATTQVIRYHASGLTADPRLYTAALVIDDDARRELASTEAGRTFLKTFMTTGNIRPLAVSATQARLRIGDEIQPSTLVMVGEFDLLRIP